MLFISELFHIVENNSICYTDDATNYAPVPKSLSRSQVMESLSQDLGSNRFLVYEVVHVAYSKKTGSMVVSRSRTYAPG